MAERFSENFISASTGYVIKNFPLRQASPEDSFEKVLGEIRGANLLLATLVSPEGYGNFMQTLLMVMTMEGRQIQRKLQEERDKEGK